MRIAGKNIGAVILAAGRGTRLGCTDCPKVMLLIGGRPILSYIVETLLAVGFARDSLVAVIGFQKEKVREYFGDRISYASQTEQNGTAHAAYIGLRALPETIEQVLVLGGDDSAFYTAATLRAFMDEHILSGATLSLLTAELDAVKGLGRVVRHPDGRVEVVEKEYLTEEQKKIKEISTGTYCFDRAWFETMFKTMPKLRKLGEYGLPTAVAMARAANLPMNFVKLKNPNEWHGINTPEELEEARLRLSVSAG